jgi:hypothetical protein
LEETGRQSKTTETLAVLHENPTKSTGTMHIFLATGVNKLAEQSLDNDGESEIKVFTVTPEKLWTDCDYLKYCHH